MSCALEASTRKPIAKTAPAARVELLDLEAMPHDRRAHLAASRELSTRDYGVWTKLREHLWQWGSLPQGAPALAKIAGIGVPSFERAAPKLARHFDSDRNFPGAWTDDFLMQARGPSAIAPSPEAPAIDPHLSAARSAAGAAGGRASAERRRARAASQRLGPGSSDLRAGGLLEDAAKSEAKAQANEPSKDGEVAADLVTPVRGWLVPEDSDLVETNQPTTRAGTATEQAKSEGLGQAKPDSGAVARAQEDRMIEAILQACPGKIERATAGWGLKKELREWISEGCNFERDYLPVLKTFAKTNKTVTNIVNDLIRTETFRARDKRLADAARATSPKVFVVENSPPWRAWLRFLGKQSHPKRTANTGCHRTKSGWDFESEWPEGWDAARLGEAEGGARHEVPTTASS